MAHQDLPEPMLNHPHVAVRADELEAAAPADRHRRIAPPVQEQERLFAPFDCLADRECERTRNPPSARQVRFPQVDRAHFRQLGCADPNRKVHAVVLSDPCIVPGLQRRGCRGQDHLRAAQRRPEHRHVACVVDGALLLLVGSVMFLIDNDEAKIRERQEKGRASADHQLHPSLAHRSPETPALGRRNVRVPLAGLGAEPLRDPLKKLFRQGDLRQEHQRLPASGNGFGNGLKVDLGLARTGYALHQSRRVSPPFRPLAKFRGSPALVGRQFKASALGLQFRIGPVPGDAQPPEHPLALKSLHDPGTDPRQLGDFARWHRHAAPVLKRPHHAEAGGCPRIRQKPGRLKDGSGRTRLRQTGNPRRQAQHRGERVHRIAACALQEAAHGGIDRRRVKAAQYAAEARGLDPTLAGTPDGAHGARCAERDLDQVARPDTARRRQVVEAAIDRPGRQDTDDPALLEQPLPIFVRLGHRAIPSRCRFR